MPFDLVAILSALGHETDSVPQEGLAGKDDPSVWQAAQAEKRFFITQDLDFSDLRVFAPGTHAGILLVRLNDAGKETLISFLETLFQNETPEDWHGCFVVAPERKLRVRRP